MRNVPYAVVELDNGERASLRGGAGNYAVGVEPKLDLAAKAKADNRGPRRGPGM